MLPDITELRESHLLHSIIMICKETTYFGVHPTCLYIVGDWHITDGIFCNAFSLNKIWGRELLGFCVASRNVLSYGTEMQF